MAATLGRSRLERLVATFERFAKGIQSVPDSRAQTLHAMAAGIQAFVTNARKSSPRPSASAIVSGLEQGLRETPMVIAGVGKEWRAQVVVALQDAISSEYPELLVQDQQRLEKVLSRGRIRTEAEFYLVRHQLDLLEGVQGSEAALYKMYALIAAYESKA